VLLAGDFSTFPDPPRSGRVVMSWSGGKDSAMALHELQRDPRFEVVGLLTTLSREFRRVSHHGIREALLEQQAEAIGLPLHKVFYPAVDGRDPAVVMAEFEQCLGEALAVARQAGALIVGHGDIFLREVRAYRERRLAAGGMRGVFPLWGHDTRELLHRFSALGFRAVVTCVEPVAASLAGVDLSSARLDASWPTGVDPCGEHGEYHSFVHDGPVFRHPVPFVRGSTVVREGRTYTDLIPIPWLLELPNASRC
jgi:uncharacterized protein (TIGR00290 family)